MREQSEHLINRRATLGMTAAALAASLTACSGANRSPKLAEVSGRQRFKDKVVIITGATSFIGRAAAEQFAAEGARWLSAGEGRN